jgi:electron transfer flavoprotein beta subunit
MNLIVFLKHVPATDSRIRIADDGKSVVQEGLNYVISPYDELALEEALRLKEKAGSGEVTVVSMGDDSAKESLRKALATGADKAVLVKDTAQAGSDPLTTARVLSKAIEGQPYDLLLFGQQGVGADQSQVGALVAEFLNLPHINWVVKLEIEENTLKAESEIEGGHEVIECKMPAVVITQRGLNEPRYPSLKGIMAAKKKEIAEKSLADIGLSPAEVGEAGAKTRIIKLELPPPKAPGRILEGESKEAARELARILHEERKLI